MNRDMNIEDFVSLSILIGAVYWILYFLDCLPRLLLDKLTSMWKGTK